jgi:hypothetical protein
VSRQGLEPCTLGFRVSAGASRSVPVCPDRSRKSGLSWHSGHRQWTRRDQPGRIWPSIVGWKLGGHVRELLNEFVRRHTACRPSADATTDWA